MGGNFNFRAELFNSSSSNGSFALAYVVFTKEKLTVEVTDLDGIKIDLRIV
jgi:hypothetical protein